MDTAIVAPYHTGSQLILMDRREFVERCLKTRCATDDGPVVKTEAGLIEGSCTHDVCTAGARLGQQCNECTRELAWLPHATRRTRAKIAPQAMTTALKDSTLLATTRAGV